MSNLTIMMIVWGLMVTAFMALMIYRSHLTQNETDQLFLSEQAPSSIHQEQDEIVRRVNFLEPICKGVGGAAVLCTLLIAGMWIADIMASSRL